MPLVRIIENEKSFRVLISHPKTATFLYGSVAVVVERYNHRCEADYRSSFVCIKRGPRQTIHRAEAGPLERIPEDHDVLVLEENNDITRMKYYDLPLSTGGEQGEPEPDCCIQMELDGASMKSVDMSCVDYKSTGEPSRRCASGLRRRRTVGFKIVDIRAISLRS